MQGVVLADGLLQGFRMDKILQNRVILFRIEIVITGNDIIIHFTGTGYIFPEKQIRIAEIKKDLASTASVIKQAPTSVPLSEEDFQHPLTCP